MTFKIEKNIKPPASRASYPFKEMKVGDSFLVPNPSTELSHSVRISSYGYGRNNNKRFSVRKAEGGIRVWRIK